MSKEKVELSAKELKEKLTYCVNEISDLMVQQESISESIKEIKKSVKENLGVDSKVFNQLVSIRHKGSRTKYEEDMGEVLDLYDTIFSDDADEE